MNRKTKFERLSEIVPVDGNSKVGNSNIIKQVITNKGTIKKEIVSDTVIIGDYNDYKLSSLLAIGAKLNPTKLDTNFKNAVRNKVENMAKAVIKNIETINKETIE